MSRARASSAEQTGEVEGVDEDVPAVLCRVFDSIENSFETFAVDVVREGAVVFRRRDETVGFALGDHECLVRNLLREGLKCSGLAGAGNAFDNHNPGAHAVTLPSRFAWHGVRPPDRRDSTSVQSVGRAVHVSGSEPLSMRNRREVRQENTVSADKQLSRR